jgi:hypothetical protein
MIWYHAALVTESAQTIFDVESPNDSINNFMETGFIFKTSAAGKK